MKARKILKNLSVVIIGLMVHYMILAVFLKAVDPLMYVRLSDEEIRAQMEEAGVPVTINRTEVNGRNVRYLAAGNDTLPNLVYIHGAPSSMTVAMDYLMNPFLLDHFRMISYDRPGYGYSGLGKAETNLARQAEACYEVLKKINNHKPIILLGTSYGGPVAARVAMEHPELVDGLILVSAAVAPGKERTLWVSYVMDLAVTRWMVPKIFRSANDEKLTHFGELSQMETLWNKIDCPVLMIHGSADGLIYPANMDFVKSKIPPSKLSLELLEGRGHLITFNEKEWLVSRILRFAKDNSF